MKPSLPKRLGRLRKPGQARARNYRPGVAPGSLDAAPEEAGAASAPARVSLLCYGKQGVQRDARDVDVAGCRPPAGPPSGAPAGVQWLHVQGTPALAQLRALGAAYSLHPLALEDVLHREGRAKSESFDGQQFVVLNVLQDLVDGGLGQCQLSFFLGPGWLISFSEAPEALFDPVRKRVRGGGKICEHGADYLLYALADVVVDSAFPLLEALGDRLEALEDEILDDPSHDARNAVHYAKRELVQMRRAWWPQREVIATLMRDDSRILSDTTRLYLRDCHDHSVIVIDFVETYREMASSLLDTYLSAVSQRMNDVMKALTVFATIFLPLTFLTGLYGMNFDTASPWNMPELHWRYGYLGVLGVMVLVVVGMLAWFRRKRWF